MGYSTELDVIVEATAEELNECIESFHNSHREREWAWSTIKSIGKTHYTKIAIWESYCELRTGTCEWSVAALDVSAYDAPAVFCLITASSLPGWINNLGDVLTLNFWPALDSHESYPDYLLALLTEFKKYGFLKNLPEWLNNDDSCPEMEFGEELFIDDIDSFAEVQNVTPQEVRTLVPLDLSEDMIQHFIEEIIGENFHQQDWGGELNDLVTSYIRVKKVRKRAVFLLKGSGTKGKLTISKCGKNGDQIVRLLDAPVDLYIIQHIDEIDERVVYDLKSKVALKRNQGENCQMCIIDGTDTARLLRAYGKI